VEATFEISTAAYSSGSDAASAGTAPVTKIPTALTMPASKYHVLRDSVVSATGAHRNFQVCGM
jgi:hypothetical protein